jgi:glycine cleavage system aminomethyltransferase T
MKRSALFYLHRRAGARFVEHCGWELPASFASAEQEAAQICKSCGIADLSHYLKFDLKTQPAQPWWRLGAKHYLVIGESFLDPPSRATDVTSVYANLRLIGPRSKDVLCKLTSLNLSDAALPDLACAQANVAHVHGIVLRKDIRSIPAFHLLVDREYGESVWQAIVHAGYEFHLCPFGLEALQSLENRGLQFS